MKRAALTALVALSLFTVTGCTTSNSQVVGTDSLKAAASGVESQVQDAGGVVVKVGQSMVRVNKDLNAFEVGAGTASHYKYVGGRLYIDASIGDKQAYVEGTDENLKKLGVDPVQAREDAAMLTLLLSLPGGITSWSSGVTSRAALSENTVRLTVKQESLENALAAGIKDPANFFFTTGPDGNLVKWGVSDRPGAALEIVSYEAVSVEKPSDDIIVAVGSTP